MKPKIIGDVDIYVSTINAWLVSYETSKIPHWIDHYDDDVKKYAKLIDEIHSGEELVLYRRGDPRFDEFTPTISCGSLLMDVRGYPVLISDDVNWDGNACFINKELLFINDPIFDKKAYEDFRKKLLEKLWYGEEKHGTH